MSYNLVPMETDSVDIEGSNAWWQANGSVQYVPCVADNLPTIAEHLPLSTYLLEQNMEATFAVETSCLLPNHPSQGDYNNLNESVVRFKDTNHIYIYTYAGRSVVEFQFLYITNI